MDGMSFGSGIIAAPATRTIRGLSTEVLLTEEDGMPAACVLNFDHISLGERKSLRIFRR